jgi:hypothetical protein
VRVLRIASAGVVLAALALGASAAAVKPNPLTGIKAAAHPQTSSDLLPKAWLAQMARRQAIQRAHHVVFPQMVLVPTTSRLLRLLPYGGKIYVVASSANTLGTVVIGPKVPRLSGYAGSYSATEPLSATHPATVGQGSVGPGTDGTSSFGVVRDGITSVSFRAAGHVQTIPVVSNVWFYLGQSSAVQSLTLHYADGKIQTLKYGVPTS